MGHELSKKCHFRNTPFFARFGPYFPELNKGGQIVGGLVRFEKGIRRGRQNKRSFWIRLKSQAHITKYFTKKVKTGKI